MAVLAAGTAYLAKREAGVLRKENVNEVAEICVERYEEKSCSRAGVTWRAIHRMRRVLSGTDIWPGVDS